MPEPALTDRERRLLDHAQAAVARQNTMRRAADDLATLYSFILSDSGRIHDGACFEGHLAHATICGERHAIANMVMAESYHAHIAAILVADPVPSLQPSSTRPCGTCRHLIWHHGTPDSTVLLAQYVPGLHESQFIGLEKHLITALYPLAYEQPADVWNHPS